MAVDIVTDNGQEDELDLLGMMVANEIVLAALHNDISLLELRKLTKGDNLKRAMTVLKDETPALSTSSQAPGTWREEDGIIYLTVTSDGTTGPAWITRLEKKDFRLSDYAKQLLNSSEFQRTQGITCEIAILKGMLFEENDRVTRNIRVEAQRRNFTTPHPEVACLIRKTFSDEEIEQMGLWWLAVMHESIKNSGGDASVLSIYRDGGGQWLGMFWDDPDRRWIREGGFVFVGSASWFSVLGI